MALKIENVNIEDLVELKENPRKHTAETIAKIEKSMNKFGFVSPIIAMKGSKEIIAGHGRVKSAKKLKMKKVPVVYVDMERNDGLEYAIADNKLNQNSEWDFLKLNDLFNDEDLDLEVTGFDDREIQTIMDKFAVDLEFIDGENELEDEKISANEYVPTANIKMLQLYFSDDVYQDVVSKVNKLMAKYKLDNITDTIKMAVDNEFKKSK
jgi:ParB-like chromosome segregation protein Spo0J